VGSLVLVSNNDTRYVLAGPTDKTRSFVENENLGGFNIYRAGIGAIGSVKDEGYDQYRVVVFDYPGDTFHNSFPSLDSSLTKTKNTGLIIHLAPATENGAPAGTLDFYNDLSNQAKRELGVPFYGAAMLDAAIFSQDNATFLCNMVKAEERLNTTIKVLRLRLNDLAANQTVLTKCGDYLTRANDTLGAYALNPDAAFGEAADAAGSIEDLFNINQQAIGADCPQVI
jgi:hypothetical protein